MVAFIARHATGWDINPCVVARPRTVIVASRRILDANVVTGGCFDHVCFVGWGLCMIQDSVCAVVFNIGMGVLSCTIIPQRFIGIRNVAQVSLSTTLTSGFGISLAVHREGMTAFGNAFIFAFRVFAMQDMVFHGLEFVIRSFTFLLGSWYDRTWGWAFATPKESSST